VYPSLGRRILEQVYDPEALLLLCPQDGLKQVWVNAATAPVGVGNKPVQIPVVWWDEQSLQIFHSIVSASYDMLVVEQYSDSH
jgi:hypothetical protein